MAVETRGVCVPLVQVFDMPTALAFYQGVLGCETVASNCEPPHCDWIWLRLGAGEPGVGAAELMLNTAYEADSRPPEPDAERWAGHADTTLFCGCPDPDAAYEHLRAAGVAVQPPKVAPYGMKQLWVTDPDGYGLCFQCAVPSGRGWLRWTLRMATGRPW